MNSISIKEIKFVAKNFLIKRTIGPECFTVAFHQTFKEEIIPILYKFFQTTEKLSKFSPYDQEQDEDASSLHFCLALCWRF